MADKTTAPAIEFVTIEDKEPTNEYDAIIAAQIAAGPKAGYPVTAPTDKIESELRKFARAANRADKSPKRGKVTVDGDNTTVIVGLRNRIVRGEGTESTEAAAE